MRSTLLTCCLLVVVASVAPPAMATDSYIEYIDTAGTGNYNVATNWNELQLDPNTGKYVLANPAVYRVPSNAAYVINNERAYIRNGAVVTVANTVPTIAGLLVGVPGDTTKDAGGTILPRPGSTVVVRSGGVVNVASYSGLGFISPHASTVGSNYDGTLNIKDGGQYTSYADLYIGAGGSANPNKIVPYQGTGYMNITSGGQFSIQAGTAPRYLYIGAGRQADTTGKGATGIATLDGGNISGNATSGIFIAYGGGTGKLTVNETDPSNYSTSISAEDTYLSVGTAGYFGRAGGTVGGTYGFWERSDGTYIQNAGYVEVDALNVGRNHGDGLLVLNGGTFELDTDIECRIGNGGGTAHPLGGTRPPILATGKGTIEVNGGYFKSFNTKTKFIVGRGSDAIDEQAGQGIGLFVINDGLVEFNRGGGTIDNSLELGNGPYSYSYGELRVLGGSLLVDKRVLFAKNETCTGVFHVSKDAYVSLGWLGLYEFEHPDVTSVSKMIVEVAADKASEVNVYREVWIKGELEVRGNGWRPKEGDKWWIIRQQRYDSELLEGDFSTFTSDITNGLPTDPNDPNVTLSAFRGTPVAPDHVYYTVAEPGYYITFQGYTAGDANGDHKVDGGDLALMGGAWMQSGKGWGDGNFNNDPNGMVDGGDLALMGGNWMWTLPTPAPGAPLPEPATLALLSLGGIALIRRRRS